MYNNNPYGFNPYYQPMNNTYNQPLQNNTMNTQSSAANSLMNTRQSLNGKLVDSVDVVKSMEIPLDGSISYFPLTDNSAIITKSLNTDGTSKITVYKPVVENTKDTPKYVTFEDLESSMSKVDDLKEELRDLKQDFKDYKKNKKKED